jgi:hypothetical protein
MPGVEMCGQLSYFDYKKFSATSGILYESLNVFL